MQEKLDSRIAKRKSNKKDKQKVKSSEEPSTSKSTSAVETKVKTEKTTSDDVKPGTSGAPPAAASKLPEKSLKRSKLDKLAAPEFKKAKDDYSVASDPKASDVYKSLFTTHDTEQTQDRAHWVTYNPFYN